MTKHDVVIIGGSFSGSACTLKAVFASGDVIRSNAFWRNRPTDCAAGLARIGQIARTPADLLGLMVGNLAPQLRSFALGIDERPVIPVRAPAKSYGEQETFAADTTDEEFLEAALRRMADKLMAKVRADGKSIRTVSVKVRYNDMDEQQASESLREPTDIETEIYSTTSALLRKAWQRRVSLRLVSLKLSNVYDSRFRSVLGLDVAGDVGLALRGHQRDAEVVRRHLGQHRDIVGVLALVQALELVVGLLDGGVVGAAAGLGEGDGGCAAHKTEESQAPGDVASGSCERWHIRPSVP